LELADPVLDGPLARERLRPEERERPQVGALRAADLDRFLPGHPPCLSALNDDSPSHPDSSPLPATDPIGAPDPPGPSGGRELAPRWRATPPSGGSFANVEEGRDMGNGWSGRRVAIVEGCRTPFARANTVFRGLSAIDLGTLAVRELLFRAALDPNEVDELVYGTVVHSVTAPNIAREVLLGAGLPATVPAFTVSRACASANQAITSAADTIARGYADVVIAGGAESLTDIPILVSRSMRDRHVRASRAKTLGGRIKAFAGLRPKEFVPMTPAIAEPSTGETMGQSAERMAKENGISREEQ